MFGLVQLVSSAPVIPSKDMTVKRDHADVTGILNKLDRSTSAPCSVINKLVTTKAANQENVTPHLNGIAAALKTADAELAALDPYNWAPHSHFKPHADLGNCYLGA
ncbi:hypothetical protein FRC11_000328 [Ceratobasidium sp. 423]|nr:hypothetical protein FRC11_000328 [Ceratobasidium sp. 423]